MKCPKITRIPNPPPKQMTAIKAGAVSRPSVDWNAIDWRAIHEMVRRLQACIVKATQQFGLSVVKPRPAKGV